MNLHEVENVSNNSAFIKEGNLQFVIAKKDEDDYENLPYRYGFFTNQGGFSNNPYCSLNFGLNVGDQVRNVLQNYSIASQTLKSKIVVGNQDHTNIILDLNEGNIEQFDVLSLSHKRITCDGLFTKIKNIAVGSLSADCITLLIYAPKNKTIAAIHAGWKGSFLGIHENVINHLEALQEDPNQVKIYMGPSIFGRNYEVRQDFLDNCKKSIFAKDAIKFITQIENKLHFDHRKFVKEKYLSQGIIITSCDLDTYSDGRFFSHRKANQSGMQTGRFLSFIKLK